MTRFGVDAHTQAVTHRYEIRYPDHQPRKNDPNYKDFEAYHRRTRPTARCAVGLYYGDFDDCADTEGRPLAIDERGQQSGLELHHSHIEFALANAIDLKLLERDYPGVSDPTKVGAWVESADNLEWLCSWHHRGHGGAHVISVSDGHAADYIRSLFL